MELRIFFFLRAQLLQIKKIKLLKTQKSLISSSQLIRREFYKSAFSNRVEAESHVNKGG